ncbi:UDP-N-acetylmuramoyl-tripeptide--D-alanyl-D-alanine ligase [Mucilaginibacter psychrotolerans]|uniref:UDP-N-acetylmuramoyl-tripeptide--D-alanyl-D-alanine ligase n=1 Tax=Mucilaginibacter psychrotolerans TaxID=1524096 RepID=A0A4Y8SP45_9SPHI|nr:UDP-N-acetylmuramoyl-tripeptide--D-alanyl-D-alanine ligase [Mucilaginibacter psychrotolerans]TFF40166.1 UDP-N-acetylmuramoyl-tripeptide--D-alanyl-D-alanine ligase [Mucilaginibacter psychrotolerans]
MATTEDIYQLYLQHPVISTDTRKIAPGSLFFALKGDKFDANTFAEKAIEAGAAYAIIDNPAYALGQKYILVADGLTALQELATHHRRQLHIPIIGLTGTNGKTTTKELINAVLSQRFNTLATEGNLNNHIGVPLTLLKITAEHEMAVIEMGANHQREIALLCSIAQPSHGLITNVGKAHLEGFGGVEGVKKGKGEMYDYLTPQPPEGDAFEKHNGVAFINSDDAVLMAMKDERGLSSVIYYGKNDHSDNIVSGKLLDSSPLLILEWKDNLEGGTYTVATHLTGAYNLDNILVAIAVGSTFGLSPEEINAGVAGYEPKNNRSQILHTANNTLICDFYNANPSSMFVAIENMDKMQSGHKVLILGDMFEMGDESAAEHAAVLQKAREANVNERIFIGKDFASVSPTADESLTADKPTFYLTAEDAMVGLKRNPITNATVLIKGSRGMALERLVALF